MNDKFIPQETLRQAYRPKNSVLASEMASSQTDPRFYAAMQILPNPDPVLRKLGRASEVYEAIGYDAHVMGELRSIRGKLLKNEWRIMPGGDQPKDIEAYELVKSIFNRPPEKNSSWSDLIWNMQSSVFYGYSVAEISWGQFGNHWVPVKIADKPNRRFCFGSERDLRLLSKNNQLTGEAVPDYKFLVARHMPKSDNPYGVAVFSALFWPYTFKHNGFRWCTKFVERYGMPSPIGRYPMGTEKSEQLDLKNSLVSMIEDAVAVVPEGTGVELLEAKFGSHHPHFELINLCNREASKALTSQTLGSEVTESGSRSTAEVQKDRQENNSESDSEMVQRNMQNICDWITEINFDDDTAPPVWQFYNEKQATEAQARTMQVITSIVPVKAEEVYNTFQLTKPEENDEVVFTAQTSTANEPSSFSEPTCTHNFSDSEKSELDRLAEQADDEGHANLERIIHAVEEMVEQSDDIDEAIESIADLIGVSDIEQFRQSIEGSNVIATALGFEDGRN